MSASVCSLAVCCTHTCRFACSRVTRGDPSGLVPLSLWADEQTTQEVLNVSEVTACREFLLESHCLHYFCLGTDAGPLAWQPAPGVPAACSAPLCFVVPA